MSVKVGQRVVINKSAPYFQGHEASIAYVGTGGVSVYLTDSEFDECIPLKYGEFESQTGKEPRT